MIYAALLVIAILMHGAGRLADGGTFGFMAGLYHGDRPNIHLRLYRPDGSEVLHCIEPLAVAFEGDSAVVFDGICTMNDGRHLRFDARADDMHVDRLFIRVDGQTLVAEDITNGFIRFWEGAPR